MDETTINTINTDDEVQQDTQPDEDLSFALTEDNPDLPSEGGILLSGVLSIILGGFAGLVFSIVGIVKSAKYYKKGGSPSSKVNAGRALSIIGVPLNIVKIAALVTAIVFVVNNVMNFAVYFNKYRRMAMDYFNKAKTISDKTKIFSKNFIKKIESFEKADK